MDSRGEERGGGYRRPRSASGSMEDERDALPEWCLEDAEEETGTFDSSGAFLPLKVCWVEDQHIEHIFRALHCINVYVYCPVLCSVMRIRYCTSQITGHVPLKVFSCVYVLIIACYFLFFPLNLISVHSQTGNE